MGLLHWSRRARAPRAEDRSWLLIGQAFFIGTCCRSALFMWAVRSLVAAASQGLSLGRSRWRTSRQGIRAGCRRLLGISRRPRRPARRRQGRGPALGVSVPPRPQRGGDRTQWPRYGTLMGGSRWSTGARDRRRSADATAGSPGGRVRRSSRSRTSSPSCRQTGKGLRPLEVAVREQRRPRVLARRRHLELRLAFRDPAARALLLDPSTGFVKGYYGGRCSVSPAAGAGPGVARPQRCSPPHRFVQPLAGRMRRELLEAVPFVEGGASRSGSSSTSPAVGIGRSPRPTSVCVSTQPAPRPARAAGRGCTAHGVAASVADDEVSSTLVRYGTHHEVESMRSGVAAPTDGDIAASQAELTAGRRLTCFGEVAAGEVEAASSTRTQRVNRLARLPPGR